MKKLGLISASVIIGVIYLQGCDRKPVAKQSTIIEIPHEQKDQNINATEGVGKASNDDDTDNSSTTINVYNYGDDDELNSDEEDANGDSELVKKHETLSE